MSTSGNEKNSDAVKKLKSAPKKNPEAARPRGENTDPPRFNDLPKNIFYKIVELRQPIFFSSGYGKKEYSIVLEEFEYEITTLGENLMLFH